jgi:hypothetical protein
MSKVVRSATKIMFREFWSKSGQEYALKKSIDKLVQVAFLFLIADFIFLRCSFLLYIWFLCIFPHSSIFVRPSRRCSWNITKLPMGRMPRWVSMALTGIGPRKSRQRAKRHVCQKPLLARPPRQMQQRKTQGVVNPFSLYNTKAPGQNPDSSQRCRMKLITFFEMKLRIWVWLWKWCFCAFASTCTNDLWWWTNWRARNRSLMEGLSRKVSLWDFRRFLGTLLFALFFA